MIELALFLGVTCVVSYLAGVQHERRRSRTLQLPPLKRP